MDLAIGMIFLSQTSIGILGNSFLLCHYFLLYYKKSRLRSTDLILRHMFIANSFIILSKGLPHTMAAFGFKNFFNEIGCTFILYIRRIGRGMSIGTICLLSVFQRITISPMNSCWKDLKVKAQKYIGFLIISCWTLQMVVNLIFPLYGLYMSGEQYGRNITKKKDVGHCQIVDYGTVLDLVYTALISFPEFFFSVLMIWTSGSMVFILYRHKWQVQHIHITNASLKCPEARATQSILLLVITFVSFYTLSSIFHLSIALFYNHSFWLMTTSALISVFSDY
ncbi:vomeronasal type-1 receptor 4-like [Heterocephalus glaber]|uniref:Vomeronasal type-1 receptor n=1 Tax=Heterocephalus glaber TaxID=10181 RepID=A0AAX6S0N8_HETGA|nr:vomeronasal type-1 receptor 4-like [Heterocephalus glaber]